MKKIKPFASILLLSLFLLCSCNSIKTVDYKEVSYGTEVDKLEEITGEKPNEEVKNEDESTSYVYKKSKILDYTGTMSYCALQGKILFSRWETAAKTAEEGKDTYHTLCDYMQKQYGEGTETKEGDTSNTMTYQGKNKTVIVAYLEQEGNYVVSITDMEQNPSNK